MKPSTVPSLHLLLIRVPINMLENTTVLNCVISHFFKGTVVHKQYTVSKDAGQGGIERGFW